MSPVANITPPPKHRHRHPSPPSCANLGEIENAELDVVVWVKSERVEQVHHGIEAAAGEKLIAPRALAVINHRLKVIASFYIGERDGGV